MQSLTRTATVDGTEARLVTIECTTTSGFAGMQMVGNISDLCRDGKERAKTVLEREGYKMGHKRILINFSPADCRKEGNHFDLPIAISLAALTGERALRNDPKDWLFAAELGLDGSLRPAKGIVPLILTAIEHGLKGVVIAAENADEMMVLEQVAKVHGTGFQYLCFHTLKEVLAWLVEGVGPPEVERGIAVPEAPPLPNFDDMHLDENLQRIAICFATGRHSLLMKGTPGCGKSMFAQRLPSLLPRLQGATHLDALRIHSLVDKRISTSLLRGHAPFRQPHHTTNPFALLGTAQEPGEMSLAHGGVLFLDELTEFRRDLLESLREPLETGLLNISRAHRKITWKSKVQLIAACNTCPCGFTDSSRKLCKCSSKKILGYMSKMSGPLLERIDMHYKMPELLPSQLKPPIQKQTDALLTEVARSRAFMHKRWGNERDNAETSIEDIFESSQTSTERRVEIMTKLSKICFSSRSTVRLLRVARTLADMDQCIELKDEHVDQAVKLRP